MPTMLRATLDSHGEVWSLSIFAMRLKQRWALKSCLPRRQMWQEQVAKPNTVAKPKTGAQVDMQEAPRAAGILHTWSMLDIKNWPDLCAKDFRRTILMIPEMQLSTWDLRPIKRELPFLEKIQSDECGEWGAYESDRHLELATLFPCLHHCASRVSLCMEIGRFHFCVRLLCFDGFYVLLQVCAWCSVQMILMLGSLCCTNSHL